jgi:predicted dehydrogenase
VDAVVVVDDGSGSHARYAEFALRAGVPTFCDKPLGMTARAAKATADLAKSTGTPFLSASSLRFVPDIVALRKRMPSLGRVNLATSACGNSLVYYGIHALSIYYAVVGGGALSCVNVGSAGRNIVRVRFADGRDLVLLVAERETMRAGYAISLFGTAGWETVSPNLANLYSYLLEAFLEVARTGRAPYPVDEEVEVVAVLEAGERSLAEGREVSLTEVLG